MINRDNSSEWYYVDGGEQERHINQMMDNVYAEAITINQSFWSEADIDTRFKTGDQSIYSDYYGNLPAFRRRQFSFNRIRRICNLITGYQRKNRRSIIATPVENNDQQAADQYTKLLYWTANRCNEPEMISEAFDHGSITTGMSLLHYWIDHTHDPESGDIMCDHVPYNSFLIDPYFKKKDFTDCNFIWRRQWVSKNAAKRLLPGRDEEIDGFRPRGNRDGKFQFMAEAYNYAMQHLLAYDEYYYLDNRPTKFLIETNTRLTREWMGSEDNLKQFLNVYPNVVVKNASVPTVRLAIVVEGKVMYDGPQQTSSGVPFDRYPFVPFIGYYEPNLPYFPWRIQGVVRNLRDAQFLYNRRKIIELAILESQVTSGFKYKPGSLVNPNDIHLAGEGRGIAIKDNKEMTDVEKIIAPDIPASMIQLSEILGREIMEISGVNEELLGAADDDKAAILAQLRQGAGLTTLQVLFDQLDFSMKLCGEIRLELIQKNFSYGKVARILGEEPFEDFRARVYSQYDVRIEEGINTTTQRQLAFAQKLQLFELGLPISPQDLLEEATMQNKDQVIQNIQAQQQQQQQLQQQELQMQMFKIQAEAKALDAAAIANEGLGVERISRVQENRALAIEKISESNLKKQQGSLDYAKTLKELQEIDLNQIQKLIMIANAIKQGIVLEEGQTDTSSSESLSPTFSLSDSLSGK